MDQSCASEVQCPIFNAPCGDIQGWQDGPAIVRATGIPYARAARFQPPVAILDLQDQVTDSCCSSASGQLPFQATRWCPFSPQIAQEGFELVFGPQTRDLEVSEHCQRLSVIMPAGVSEGEKLPVMVWVHGGSYVGGAADSSLTDHAQMVAEHRVIVVNVSYRLGVLGFLGTNLAPANLGLLDIREALRWVRRNIFAFGGDPELVTAFGESAGADAICHLMAAMGHELLQGSADELLFDRAILTSPPLGIRKGRAKMTGLMSKAVNALLHKESTVAEVLGAQLKAQEKAKRFGFAGAMPFGVQYGHQPLPEEDQVEAAWRAIAPRIPMMVGTVGTEASLFTRESSLMQRIRAVPGAGEAAYWAIVESMSKTVFTKPASNFAELWSHAGGEAQRFDIPWCVNTNPMRSPHGIDVTLLSATQDTWRSVMPFAGATWNEIHLVGKAIRRYFCDFATGATDHPLTSEPRAIRGYSA